MTTMFEERERAAEWAFAHEGEVRFLAYCTAIKRLGLYAAERSGRGADEAEAEAYAKDLVAAWVEGRRDESVIERIRTDLESRGVGETKDALRQRLAMEAARGVTRSAGEA